MTRTTSSHGFEAAYEQPSGHSDGFWMSYSPQIAWIKKARDLGILRHHLVHSEQLRNGMSSLHHLEDKGTHWDVCIGCVTTHANISS